MRIAYITRSAFGVLGGAASYLFPSYMQAHAEVIVLSPHPPKIKEKIIFSNNNIRVINTYSNDINTLLRNTCAEIEKFTPDIIHIFHNSNLLNYMMVLKVRFPTIKVVIDFRSPPIISERHELRRTRYMYFLSHTYANHIFTHSIKTISQNLPVRFSKVTEIPPGVELDKFAGNNEVAKRLNKFVYIGSLSHARQVDNLIKAFINIIKNSDQPITLDLYGEGNAVESLGKIVLEQNLSSRIRLNGIIAQNDLFAILDDFDAGIAYVPDKLYAAAPSLKSLEYAAAGLPIYASNTLGHRDYCKRYGFNFKLFDNHFNDFSIKIMGTHDLDEVKSQVNVNRKAILAFDWRNIVKNKLLPAYHAIIRR